MKSYVFISAFLGCFFSAITGFAATFPESDLALQPAPKIPFDVSSKVHFWIEGEPIAECKVGVLSLNQPDEARSAQFTGRLMVFGKSRVRGASTTLKYTLPSEVFFIPDDKLSCKDPIPASCDCELAFFPVDGNFEVFAEVPRAPEETTPYVSVGSVPATIAPSFPRARTGSSDPSSPGADRSHGSGGDAPDDESADDIPSKPGPSSTSGATDLIELDFADRGIDLGLNDYLITDFARVTTQAGSKIYVYEPNKRGLPNTGAICGYDTGYWCTADLYFDFFDEVVDLEFQTFFFGGADKILAQVFSGEKLLSEIEILDDGVVSFEGISPITRLVLLNSSPKKEGSAGAAFGNFSFRLKDIPLPSTSGQLFLGMGIILVLRKRLRSAGTETKH